MTAFPPTRFALLAALGLSLAAGCNQVSKESKTLGADMLAEGHGQIIATADRSGKIMVWDNDTDKLIYEADVSKGDKVDVNPGNKSVSISGIVVAQPELTTDHRYQIYEKH